MIDVRELRGWVLSAYMAMPGELNPDSRVAEVLQVIGRRIEEICGTWPFPGSAPLRTDGIDYRLSFTYRGAVDPHWGYGPEAYAYCYRYTLDNQHIWPRLGRVRAEAETCGAVIHSPVDDPEGLL